MGLFSFIADAGEKLFGKDDAAKGPTDAEVQAALDLKVMQYGWKAEGFKVTFANGTATLVGKTSPEIANKMVVTLGNMKGVSQVDDQMVRVDEQAKPVPAPPIAHHTVVKGDTLSAISSTYYHSPSLYNVIFDANKPMLSHPDKIYPGQVLIIPLDPAAIVHEVKKGDTLGSIAKQYLGNASQYKVIFEANRDQLSNPDVIKVGQRLKIPVAKPD